MLFQIFLIVSTVLCSLVAGFLFAFAVVGMPGIGALDDKAFLQAFQKMDRVIQNRQPVFMLVWVGSLLALLVTLALGFVELGGWPRVVLILASVLYLSGVQALTFLKNIPLNNRLQKLDLDALDDEALRSARGAFEPEWNRWNAVRTVVACLNSLLLVGLCMWL